MDLIRRRPYSRRMLALPGDVTVEIITLTRPLSYAQMTKLLASAELYILLGTLVDDPSRVAAYVGESGQLRSCRVVDSLRRWVVDEERLDVRWMVLVRKLRIPFSYAARRHIEAGVTRELALRVTTLNRKSSCPGLAPLLTRRRVAANLDLIDRLRALIVDDVLAGVPLGIPTGGTRRDVLARALARTGRGLDRDDLMALARAERVATGRTPWRSVRRDLRGRERDSRTRPRVVSCFLRPEDVRIFYARDLSRARAVNAYRRARRIRAVSR